MRLSAVARGERPIELRLSGEVARTRRKKSVTGNDGRRRSLWRRFSGRELIEIRNRYHSQLLNYWAKQDESKTPSNLKRFAQSKRGFLDAHPKCDYRHGAIVSSRFRSNGRERRKKRIAKYE
ncbi:hypothetical protein CDAR_448661 [Caerostris darwini]|uniref:Uncharacterized protein n=1 Tax=Caerostris darwini TaxID=1538125 RepID=A0AAV4QPL2_9ARAC|nr:hypothetical protein CDAR_448661 [Caerostris darwini]